MRNVRRVALFVIMRGQERLNGVGRHIDIAPSVRGLVVSVSCFRMRLQSRAKWLGNVVHGGQARTRKCGIVVAGKLSGSVA